MNMCSLYIVPAFVVLAFLFAMACFVQQSKNKSRAGKYYRNDILSMIVSCDSCPGFDAAIEELESLMPDLLDSFDGFKDHI